MEEKIFIKIGRESVIASITKDTFTFLCLLASFYLNFRFVGNSIILQIVLAICFFLFVLGKTNIKKIIKEFPDRESAIEYLKNK